MSIVNQIMNNIREELANPEPSYKRIITLLSDLRIKEEYQSLSDSEFYDIVGETFKLNPEFFMNHIYPEMRGGKLSKKINKMEMEKYIIEKFCLYEGEQILYECNGKIAETNPTMKVMSTPVKASVDGRIYVTNYRIIAHGKLSVSGGRWWGLSVLDLAIGGMTGGSKRDKSKRGMIEGSTSQELPCYGFQYKTNNHVRLKKMYVTTIQYNVHVDKVEDIGNLSRVKQVKALVQAGRIVRLTLPSSEERNNLFKVFCKNVYHTINSFYELHELGLGEKLMRKEFLYRLRKLWDSEEYQQLSDSEYLEIVEAVYNIDPEFFMTMVYPKMMSWTFPSFLKIKSEISEILNK